MRFFATIEKVLDLMIFLYDKKFVLWGGLVVVFLSVLFWVFSFRVFFLSSDVSVPFVLKNTQGKEKICHGSCRLILPRSRSFEFEARAQGFLSQVFFLGSASSSSVFLSFVAEPVFRVWSFSDWDQTFRHISAASSSVFFRPFETGFVSLEIQDQQTVLFFQKSGLERVFLTSVLGNPDTISAEFLFIVSPEGVIFPSDSALYFFDFRSQSTEKIWTGNLSEWRFVSRSLEGKLLFKNFLGRFFVFEDSLLKKLPDTVLAAVFWGNDLWTFEKNSVYRNGQFYFEVPDVSFSAVWFEGTHLFFETHDVLFDYDFEAQIF